MAVSGSGLFYLTFKAMMTATAVDLSGTVKCALFTNSITPNYDTDTAYGSTPYNANEVTDGLSVYSAGGLALTTPAFSVVSHNLKYTAANTSWASTSIASARAALLYGNTSGSKQAVCLVDFGADYTATNGTFQITWNASGIFTVSSM